VYANAAGANDSLVFDGHSLVLSASGHVSVQMPGFAEACATVDCEALAEEEAHLPATGNEQLHQALVLGLRDYSAKCGFRSACLGLSGGIDSALTAVLAAEALGPENVHGLTMPGPFSSPGSVEDSLALAANLGIRCDTVPITDSFGAVLSTLEPLFAGTRPDSTEENLQARLRGLYLMALANKRGHLLLSTGNKSELAVGYCTIYGDMAGGFALLSDLPKTRVYRLARWLNREREVIPWNSIHKPPSAELKPEQKDQDTLPPYEILDDILELYVERQLSVEEIVEHGYDEATARWVQRRVDLSEWKRQQAAPGIRVTTKAFGPGRRMPIAQSFG
jgi:NAD+ synthetase